MVSGAGSSRAGGRFAAGLIMIEGDTPRVAGVIGEADGAEGEAAAFALRVGTGDAAAKPRPPGVAALGVPAIAQGGKGKVKEASLQGPMGIRTRLRYH